MYVALGLYIFLPKSLMLLLCIEYNYMNEETYDYKSILSICGGTLSCLIY